MKLVYFENETKFESSEDLKKHTGLTKIYFDKDTSVSFQGEISFAESIHFRGQCIVSDGVSIDTGCVLNNATVGKGSNIRAYSIIEDSKFGESNLIGPFCFVRDNTFVANNSIVGSYVEVARSKINSNVKISHQAFIGDATIEKSVIIGAGVVFCNFDGKGKQLSYIGKSSIIGSGTMIVSPVKVGANVVVGAGSVVASDLDSNTKLIQKR